MLHQTSAPPPHGLPISNTQPCHELHCCVQLAACTGLRALWIYRHPILCGYSLWQPLTSRAPHTEEASPPPLTSDPSPRLYFLPHSRNPQSITDKMSNTFVSLSSPQQGLCCQGCQSCNLLHHTPDRNTTDRIMWLWKNQSSFLTYCLHRNLFKSNLSHFDNPVQIMQPMLPALLMFSSIKKAKQQVLIKLLIKKNLSSKYTHLNAIWV